MTNNITDDKQPPRDAASPADPQEPLDGGPVEFKLIKLPQPGFGLPLMQDFYRNTLGTLSRLARFGDAVRVSIFWQRVQFLFHPDLLRAALLMDEKSLAKETHELKVFRMIGQGRNLLTTVGADWKRQRKILNAAFAPRQVAAYLDLMRTAALEAHQASFPSGQRVSLIDPAQHVSLVTMDVMLRVLFNEPLSRERARGITRSVTSLSVQAQRMLYWLITPKDWMPFPGRGQLRLHRENVRQFVRAHIERRRNRPASTEPVSGDLLDTMLQAEDSEAVGDGPDGTRRLSPCEVEDNCMALFAAGYETTATALTWWMAYMASHPEHAERARRELTEVLGTGWYRQAPDPLRFAQLSFLEATLKETMRLRPPAVGIFSRRALTDLCLAGIEIKKGDIVAGSIWTLHHDPRWFPEPEAFKPERFLPGAPNVPRGAFMPFGAGPHVCIGQHFAMLEMKLIAALLLSRAAWSFPPGEDLPEPRVDVTLKPSRPLRLKVTELPEPL